MKQIFNLFMNTQNCLKDLINYSLYALLKALLIILLTYMYFLKPVSSTLYMYNFVGRGLT